MRSRGASVAELERLYRERYERFAGVAAAVLNDADAGRDVAQAAFATAIRQRATFRGDGPLEAWVWRIAVNEALRVAREYIVEALPADVVSPVTGIGNDDLGLRPWVASLPRRQRAVVFLRYYADLDYRTIAEILDVEVGTVSATLSAAHSQLRHSVREVQL